MVVLTSFAQSLSANQLNIPKISANQVLANGLNVVYFAAGVIAVIVIIIAGFTFVTSGDNPTNVTKARNAILYAVIGIVVVVSAFVITQFIIGSA